MRSSILKLAVTSLAHHFLDVNSNPSYKLSPGGPGYELVWGSTAILPYLLSLTPENDLGASFNAIANHEQTLLAPLLAFLTSPEQEARGVRIVGQDKLDLSRVPTVSFVVTGQNALKSKDVVKYFDQQGDVSARNRNVVL